VLAWLIALLLQSAYPTTPPTPQIFVRATLQDPPPRHDKYRDDPNASCAKPDVAAFYHRPSLHACECPLQCMDNRDGDGTLTSREQAEQPSCELWCTKSRCACHSEACEGEPNVEPGK
jgi:hypothetical protein